MIPKNQPLGKPRTRWEDAVEKNIQFMNVNAPVELTFNRERWRGLIVAA